MNENFQHTFGRWLATVFFCIMALMAFAYGPSFKMLAIAVLGLVLFAPPLQRLYEPRLGVVVRGWKALPVFAVFFLGLVFSTPDFADMKADEEAEFKAAEAARLEPDAKYFAAHKAEVLTNMRNLVRDGKYAEAVSLGDRYAKASPDAELAQVFKAARKADYVHQIGNEKELPLSQKALVYGELAKMEPDNKDYVAKAAKFKALNDVQIAKAEELIAEGERQKAHKAVLMKQFNQWDGSHPAVEQAVKKTMKNPDSYQHVETRFVVLDTGMRVITTFRGTNSFGGVVPTTVVAMVNEDGTVASLKTLENLD